MKSDEVVYTYMKSPFGAILLARVEAGLTHIAFQEGARPVTPGALWRQASEPLLNAIEQLNAYFEGEVIRFDLPLAAHGTPFQERVWHALRQIPCGEAISYAELAQRIGHPTAVRAVGAANGRNPLPIVVPCHRVIGKDGKLTGYAGGLTIKRGLLEHEAALVSPGAKAAAPQQQLQWVG